MGYQCHKQSRTLFDLIKTTYHANPESVRVAYHDNSAVMYAHRRGSCLRLIKRRVFTDTRRAIKYRLLRRIITLRRFLLSALPRAVAVKFVMKLQPGVVHPKADCGFFGVSVTFTEHASAVGEGAAGASWHS